jgi:hypothetical protein
MKASLQVATVLGLASLAALASPARAQVGAEPRGAGVGSASDRFELWPGATLRLSAETRLRWNHNDNARLRAGEDLSETLWRGRIAAELRWDEGQRAVAELASGSALSGAGPHSASFSNTLALNQAFVDLSTRSGTTRWGAMLGRQEFAEGPRQLVSVGDGPNLHRTWNGLRLYAQGTQASFGAFGFCATRLGPHGFDERIDCEECLRGVNASIVLSAREGERNVAFDPFWFHSELPAVTLQGTLADESRDTFGLRIWGRERRLGFDLTLAQQLGRHGAQDVNAWGAFVVQELRLADSDWQPVATLKVDVASGGRSDGGGDLRTFHPLYSSSSHLGEGRLLGLANLVRLAPGFTFRPSPRTRLSAEFGWAWRFATEDAVYGLGFRAYPGTVAVGGHELGQLFRLDARWIHESGVSLALGFEHLQTGSELADAGLAPGSFAFASLTLRH